MRIKLELEAKLAALRADRNELDAEIRYLENALQAERLLADLAADAKRAADTRVTGFYPRANDVMGQGT